MKGEEVVSNNMVNMGRWRFCLFVDVLDLSDNYRLTLLEAQEFAM